MDIALKLSEELGIRKEQAENTIQLIDSGCTVPFIARYRKEATGGLDDTTLRTFSDRLTYLRSLEDRKQEIKKIIEERGKLTEELASKIDACEKLTELEDLYRPYKEKRRTRASDAREKGLEPLSEIVLKQELLSGNIDEICAPFINEKVETTSDALKGAMDIIAEIISDDADVRKFIREFTVKHGIIKSKGTEKEQDTVKRDVYEMYREFEEPVKRAAQHRILALNRGEKEGFLSVKIVVEDGRIIEFLEKKYVAKTRSITSEYVSLAAADAYKRLLQPSIEKEIRNSLTETAHEGAVKLFAENLKHLLLQPPVKNKVVLGFDPAYRTGCKIAVADRTGKVLDTAVVYPTPPQNRTEEAKAKLKQLIKKHGVEVISIGNGTASKESEIFASELVKEVGEGLTYIIVNEAGASVYSASELGAEEFPDMDVSLRGAVSIARRLQDPLAELVKIDPKAIGVGQYQHDMNQKQLSGALDGVVEGCVNSVGAELNTASASLLSHIAGINVKIAKNIVKYREETGGFKSRAELKKVSGLGNKAFEQCAGFLRVPESDCIFDNTSVHPESYKAAEKLLSITGFKTDDVKYGNLEGLKEKVSENISALAEQCGVGAPTLRDITDELLKPGRDPRGEIKPQEVIKEIMDIADLKEGMVLSGTVRNITDFGAFVDIGVHQDGLVHISHMSEKFVKHPRNIVSTGQIVKVKVLNADTERKRISLSMII